MRQFVLPSSWMGEGPCRVEGGEARYLLRVLRLVPGDSFPGLDSGGLRRMCKVLAAGEGWLELAISAPLEGIGEEALPDARGSRGKARAPAGPAAQAPGPGPAADAAAPAPGRIPIPRIILVQSMAKGPAMDLVIRQAAEAGVARVIPLEARRSVARAEEGRGASRQGRWERILREGLQQSGSPVATVIDEPVGLRGLVERLGPEPEGGRIALVLHEAPLAQKCLHGYLCNAPAEIVLCVGPEGGFAPDEIDFLLGAGFRPLLLPGAILRTETAALFAVAAVEIILSERSSWTPSL
jgi:16S rRNA (uracil1498-N3)-methyltransferase